MKRIVVARAALLARINRKLARDGKRLYAAQGQAKRAALGAFYVLDLTTRRPVRTELDLRQFALELGVLEPWEAPE